MHLQNIEGADITNGYHCGYISPIPQIVYNDILTESDFGKFIGTISNDIVTWESVQKNIKNGGVTYADTSVLVSNESIPIEEVNHCQFISGSNLCINLKTPERTFPFFIHPGERGEDTFLSTLLAERNVVRIPCFTFHDGFSAYHHLLDGVLPLHLTPISAKSGETVTRFYNACIGWIRYRHYIYITQPENYEEIILEMKATLKDVLPQVCKYFERDNFMQIIVEMDKYSKNIKRHHYQFLDTKIAWEKVLSKRKYWQKH